MMQTRNDLPEPDSEERQEASSRKKEKKPWQRPEIASSKPVADTQGLGYLDGDGISNLS
jgi:hypothetical protein